MEQKTQLIQELQNCIRSVESGTRAGAEQTVSSGCSALDRLLPESGYQRGSLVQWITAGGNGVDYLSLVTAREACRNGGSLVVIDPANQFYPPAAAAIGLPLERTIIHETKRLGHRQGLDLRAQDPLCDRPSARNHLRTCLLYTSPSPRD